MSAIIENVTKIVIFFIYYLLALPFIIGGTSKIVNPAYGPLGNPYRYFQVADSKMDSATICFFTPPMLYFGAHLKMSKINKIASLPLLLAFFFLPADAGEIKLVFQGRSAIPLVDKNGNFLIIHQNPSQAISLTVAPGEGQKRGIREDIIAGPSHSSPVARQDRNGEIGIVWEQSDPGKDELYYGLLQGGKLTAPRKVTEAAPSIFSPDLVFDAQNVPWLAWIQSYGPRYFVFVKNLYSGQTWLVNKDFTASAGTPRLIAGRGQKIWLFWVGQDRGRDEIFVSVSEGIAWSKPHKLNSDNRFPHLSPSPALDGTGLPWVAWSAYDGRDYEIYISHWNGRAWSKEQSTTHNEESDSSPALAFV